MAVVDHEPGVVTARPGTGPDGGPASAAPLLGPTPEQGKPGKRLWDAADLPRTRKAIFSQVLHAAEEFARTPVENTRHRLRLEELAYEDPDEYPLSRQKQAVLRGESLTRRLRGTWVLEDSPTGQEVERQRMTVARVPYLTPRGTYIHSGVEYGLGHQARLRPGVYTRRRESGEVASHVNVLPGKGVSHHLTLDPDSGVFKMEMAQSSVPLVPVLRALGATDRDLRTAWGDQLYNANLAKDDPRAVDKLFDRLLGKYKQHPEGTDKGKAVKEALQKMELDPEVTAHTLGAPHKNVSLEQMLSTTRRLLAVHKGEEAPDDRDHTAFQRVMAPEDLFAERMRNSARTITPLLWRVSARGNLKPLHPGVLSRPLEAVLMKSGLGGPMEEVNPAEMLDQVTRITRMGEGGIPSDQSIPDSSRNVHPSQYGLIDSVRTPESNKIGVDLRLAASARRGPGGVLHAVYRKPDGALAYRSAREAAGEVVAFPGEMESGQRHVAALDRGKMRLVPRSRVTLSAGHMEDSFNHLSNLVPLKSASFPQRIAMGSRFIAQALPLENPEAPLVQSGIPWMNHRSFEEEYGKHMGAVFSEQPGTIKKITPDGIVVRHDDGSLKTYDTYNNYPLNRKTLMHNTASVEPGQRVGKGALLARSNYTDEKGVTALGKNLRVAYLPDGHNFEDAISLSRSASQKLKSEHLYQHEHEHDDQSRTGLRSFQSLFPTRYHRGQLAKMGEDGVVKVGQIVHEGDPLMLVARQKDRAHNRQVLRGKDASYADGSHTWDHSTPGTVIDVEHTKKGIVVAVKTLAPMKIGDKLSGRYGDKGVIASVYGGDHEEADDGAHHVSRIVDDADMPRDRQGKPFEVLLNPLGVITRQNASQVIEAALGKVARHTGKPYKIKDFQGGDHLEHALDELRQHGLSDTEDVIDPVSGASIPGVLTGERHFLKLHHTSEAKVSGRGTGGYSPDAQPVKGSGPGGGSKRVAMMDLTAFLSHGAYPVSRDAVVVRGQRNLDYWGAVMKGEAPPAPHRPMVHEKFLAHLAAGGLHPLRQGHKVQLLPSTDAHVQELAGDRVLRSGDTVDWKHDLKPLAGGLFDPELTGGHNGTRWSSIQLPEPMPNPVMEEPIRRLLGLTKQGFEDVLAGKEEVGGRKGPAAIGAALGNVNVERDLETARQGVKLLKGSKRDEAVRRLRILKDVEKTGIHPRDWMMARVPVIPPRFRPVGVMGPGGPGGGRPQVADANYVYKDLLDATDAYKQLAGQVDDTGNEQLAVYDAFKAVTGLGEPINPKFREQGVRGLLGHVFGPGSPKFSMPQRKLLSGTVDLVGRAVISPDADLDMDEIGLPEKKAWDVYKPFIIRNLVRKGVNPLHAAEMAKAQAEPARKALLEEVKVRPVVATRAPVLHRYGTMAFYPRLVKGDTLKVNPFIVKGFGADFDGDQMNYHVVADDKAVESVLDRMLPSRNLYHARDFKVHQLPANEFQAGLYEGTRPLDEKEKARPERTFKTRKAALAAYQAGEIGPRDPVVILE